MFRAPNVEAARARRASGWDSHDQRAATERWLRGRQVVPAETAEMCWQQVLSALCEDLTGVNK